jgi:hypothetical protein
MKTKQLNTSLSLHNFVADMVAAQSEYVTGKKLEIAECVNCERKFGKKALERTGGFCKDCLS